MKKTLKRKKRHEYMLINFEPNPGYGEDSAVFSFEKEYGMMSVFDGCGGLGSRKYEACDFHTGAYLAAQLGSWVINQWYEKNDPRQYMSKKNCARLLTDIKNQLTDQFHREKDNLTDKTLTRIRGSMIKTLPTTMSAAILDYSKNDEIQCLFVWAGDSRGYVLSPHHGLQQVTKDDLVMPLDAMENLYHDAPLSNMINADTPFTLNGRMITVKHPCIVITATDGIFNYFRTPMDFEFALLDTMQKAQNIKDWNKKLIEMIGDIAEDDSTAVVFIAGYLSFGQLKRMYFKRRQYMLKEYILISKDAEKKQLMDLWRGYKADYEEAGGNSREYTSRL